MLRLLNECLQTRILWFAPAWTRGPSGLYDERRLPLDLSEGRAVQRGEHLRGAGPLWDEVLSPGQRGAFGDQAETSEETV